MLAWLAGLALLTNLSSCLSLPKARDGHLQVVEFLLERKAPIDATSAADDTPLLLACWKGHADVCRILLNANANPLQQDNCSRSCLHLAAGSGLLDIVKALVACGADINATTQTQDTPLLLAAWKGRYDVVSYLLELQADPTASDNQQRNALHLAVRMLAISHPASASKPSSNRLESRSRTLAFEYRHGAGMQT